MMTLFLLFRHGLSPRVRGNPTINFSEFWTMGSIPAGAGEPKSPLAPLDISPVYPRGCGGTLYGLHRPNQS